MINDYRRGEREEYQTKMKRKVKSSNLYMTRTSSAEIRSKKNQKSDPARYKIIRDNREKKQRNCNGLNWRQIKINQHPGGNQ